MTLEKHTLAGEALTNLVLELFRLNNRMLTAGDRLVADIGLTSARWQVLGTIAAAERPQPVAWLARDMGANRQNIQRIVNDLVRDGLLEFQPNPHHRRAQLVVLTSAGRDAFANAMRVEVPWANALADGLEPSDLQTTHQVLTALRRRLEGATESESLE
ncbi:MarR family transcriptional regulator [Ralstonia insidiosa]|uniref:MarR family winged helix-turn-helix transcriptional regulator n=1 Tax=Ralstonia insidiosa TaxID=190721 RepID=UPI000AB92E0E|nr:MarR family winged helix-turn-helix transcriptional regulator [Ralstonia insidiosa]MBY4912413.1 MarR family transcriptional regulator [Ralstonia insidiosa]